MALITIATGRLDADLTVRIRGIRKGIPPSLKADLKQLLPPTERFKAHGDLALDF
jgi:hypothetical protein